MAKLKNPDPKNLEPCRCQIVHLEEPDTYKLGKIPYFNTSLQKILTGNCGTCNYNNKGDNPGWRRIPRKELSEDRLNELIELLK